MWVIGQVISVLTKSISPRERIPDAGHAGMPWIFPIEVAPVGGIIVAGGMEHGQGLADRVIRLLTAEHLDRPDHRLAIVRAALEAVDPGDWSLLSTFSPNSVNWTLPLNQTYSGITYRSKSEIPFLAVIDDMTVTATCLYAVPLFVPVCRQLTSPRSSWWQFATREGWNVTGLTGDLVGVDVELGDGCCWSMRLLP